MTQPASAIGSSTRDRSKKNRSDHQSTSRLSVVAWRMALPFRPLSCGKAKQWTKIGSCRTTPTAAARDEKDEEKDDHSLDEEDEEKDDHSFAIPNETEVTSSRKMCVCISHVFLCFCGCVGVIFVRYEPKKILFRRNFFVRQRLRRALELTYLSPIVRLAIPLRSRNRDESSR